MARSGGLFGWIADTFERIVDAVIPDTGPREAPTDFSTADTNGGDYADESTGNETTFVTESNDPPGQDSFPFDFQLAGFLELGASPKDDYVNLEGDTVYLQYLPWADIDYFVFQVNEPGKDSYYVTITGPFDDYDDLLAHLEQWWEEGS